VQYTYNAATNTVSNVDWSFYDPIYSQPNVTLIPIPGPMFNWDDPSHTWTQAETNEAIAFWKAVAIHYKAMGWFNRAFLYTLDEPGSDWPLNVVQATALYNADPGFMAMVTNPYTKALSDGHIRIWTVITNELDNSPGFSSIYGPEQIAGNKVWWYDSTSSGDSDNITYSQHGIWADEFIDHQGVNQLVHGYMHWKYHLDGYLYYAITYAYGLGNPWIKNYGFARNGDGTLFYPGTPAQIGGTTNIPVSSLRLELLRLGWNTFDYMTLLKNAGQSAFVDSVVNPLVTNSYTWSHTALDYDTARDQLGTKLDQLNSVSSNTGANVYYLPFLANNYASGSGSFTSYLSFQNTVSVTANINLQYFDANGNVVGVAANTCTTVASYGECTAPNPFANGNKGTGILTSDQPLSVVVAEATPAGGSAYSVSAGSWSALVAPFALNGAYGGFVTQLNVFNGDSNPVTATISFYNADGSAAPAASSHTVTIPAHNTYNLDQSDPNSGLPTGFNGWAQISSDNFNAKLVAQVLEQNPNTHFVAIANAGLGVAVGAGITPYQSTQYAPAIFNSGYAFTTGTNIINPNSNAVTVTVNYYAKDGTALTPLTFRLAAHALAAIYQGSTSGIGVPSGGLPIGFVGSAVVTATGGGSIVMVVNEAGGTTASGSAESGVYSAAGAGANLLGLPVIANGGYGYTTGTTILNVGTASAHVTVSYYNVNGTLAATAQSYTIAPNASQPIFQGTPGLGLPANFFGTAVVTGASGEQDTLLDTTNAVSNSFFYTYVQPSN
jgi:hypothetical protein